MLSPVSMEKPLPRPVPGVPTELGADSPELRALLDSPHVPHREVPRARQIYVNRNLRMDRIDAVGFDMDYTLAIYHLRQLETLAFQMTLARMIRFMGYPASLGALRYDPDFVIRG